MKNYKFLNVSINENIYKELEFICEKTNFKKSQIVAQLIHAEYDKLNGSKSAQKMLEALTQMQKQVDAINKELDIK